MEVFRPGGWHLFLLFPLIILQEASALGVEQMLDGEAEVLQQVWNEPGAPHCLASSRTDAFQHMPQSCGLIMLTGLWVWDGAGT